MKIVSDDLFRLVKSLNKSEKGYFKKFAKRNTPGETNNYILLFDAADSMDTYDEELLKKKISDKKLLKNLSVYKVYLFNLILKSLSLYTATNNADSQLTEMTINIKTLEARALYREALKMLKKAKAISYKYEKLKFLQELLSLERKIIITMPDKNTAEKRKQVHAEQAALLEKIKEQNEYSWLCDRMTILVDQTADFTDRNVLNEMKEIISNPLMKSENNVPGYSCKNYYCHTQLMYHSIFSGRQSVLNWLKKEIENAEKHRHFIDENPQSYFYSLINFLLYSSYENNTADVRETLVKINALRKRLRNRIPREQEIKLMFHGANIEMIIYEKNREMEKGRRKSAAIEKDLKKFGSDIPSNSKSLLLSNLATFNFLDKNYTGSLKFINMLLNDPELNHRGDVNDFAKIFQLIIHFELGNFDLLEYLVNPAYKYFAKNRNYYKTELAIVQFIKKALKLREEELKPEFMLLLENFEMLEKENARQPSFFSFKLWIQSKIKNKDIVKMAKDGDRSPS